MGTRHRQTLPRPKILLPVCVSLPYSVFPSQHTHSQILHKERTITLTRSNVPARECTTVALAQLRNWREERPSSRSNLHSSVTGRLVESITRGV